MEAPPGRGRTRMHLGTASTCSWGWILPEQPDCLLWDDSFYRWRMSTGQYLVCNTVSPKIENKLGWYGLDWWTVRGVKDWMAISSKIRSLISAIPQCLIMGPTLLKIFIKNLNKRTRCTVLVLSGDIKFRKTTEMLEGSATSQRDSGKLEERASRNFINLTRTDAKSCTWGRITPCTRTGKGQHSRKTL